MGWSDPDGDGAEEIPEPRRLRQLRWLVNALLLVLIAGTLTITTLLAIRLVPQRLPPLPEAVTLPGGERAEAVTFGRDWIALVTVDAEGRERIRLLDRATGRERATVPIRPGE